MSLLSTSVPTNFNTTDVYEGQNNMNVTPPPVIEFKEWYQNVLPAYILVISVLGIVLNLFVLMVFCLHKKSCTVAEIYLSNMAFADFVLMSFLPFWAVYAANKFDWPFANPLCKVITLSINVNAYSSIYFLVLISIDRCMALVNPLSNRGIRRPKNAKLACVLVWGIGFLLSIPTLVFKEVQYDNYHKVHKCHFNLTGNKLVLHDGILTAFGFIIPTFIILCCTFKIFHTLNNRLLGRSNTKTEQKTTTLIVAVLLSFMICWMPFHVLKILYLLFKAKVLTEGRLIANILLCLQVFMYFAFFNSVLNPILYIIVGKNFQKRVRELFKQWSPTRRRSYNATSTNSIVTRSVKT